MNAQSILPNLNDANTSMNNAKMSEQFASGSFLDAKSSQPQGGAATTSDILFLKRLLFLKAALDND